MEQYSLNLQVFKGEESNRLKVEITFSFVLLFFFRSQFVVVPNCFGRLYHFIFFKGCLPQILLGFILEYVLSFQVSLLSKIHGNQNNYFEKFSIAEFLIFIDIISFYLH